MRPNFFACLCLAVLTGSAAAQLAPNDPDWKEIDAPTVPVFSTDRLLAIEMPVFMTLRFGIDPQTLTVSQDGIVRYVAVASSPSGAVNAMYEGIRCATGEFKTYARMSNSGQWQTTKNGVWRQMDDSAASKHTRALAFQAVCEGRTVRGNSTRAIIEALQGRKREPSD